LSREVSAKHNSWIQRCGSVKKEFSRTTPVDTLEDAGWFYYRVKNYPRAVDKLERAVVQIPSAETYCWLGQAKAKLGDLEGAIEAWAKGVSLDPKSADLYKQLGTVTLDQGDKEQAELFFQEAVRLEPDDAACWEPLARLYTDRGAYTEAGACYENLLRLDPSRQQLIPQIAALYHRQIAVVANTQ
jgi:tetratricopeptide (TPR) repeat protein